ncbi:MAG: biopolymer transporter ExbD [Methylophilaceae bacterium]|nr:biopolymer transporter ExbD [Methylophilaceae bacterium]
MNFQRGKKHEDLEMNLVPLIDVLLVIIIFLVVSSTFSRVSELQINLPTAETNPTQEKPLVITVDVDVNGHYRVNNIEVINPTVDTISQSLQHAAGEGKEPTVVINADANSTHQSVVNVMEASRQAGFTHITFATQNKSGS